MNCSKLPVCFVDIGIQQIHSIVHSVAYSSVSRDDRMNEFIHMESVSALSSLSHSTHTTCSLMLMSKQRVCMLVSLHYKNFISATLSLSLFPSCLNMCTLFCFALLCAVLRAYVHTRFLSKSMSQRLVCTVCTCMRTNTPPMCIFLFAHIRQFDISQQRSFSLTNTAFTISTFNTETNAR